MNKSDNTLATLGEMLTKRGIAFTEKKMFGGTSLMVDEKFLLGYSPRGLLVRIDPDQSDELIRTRQASPMIHGGKPQAGYLYTPEADLHNSNDLEFWLNQALAFNPKAKSSKK